MIYRISYRNSSGVPAFLAYTDRFDVQRAIEVLVKRRASRIIVLAHAVDHTETDITHEFTIPKRPRRRSAMDIAADACGLVKVRVGGKTFYE